MSDFLTQVREDAEVVRWLGDAPMWERDRLKEGLAAAYREGHDDRWHFPHQTQEQSWILSQARALLTREETP